MPSYHPPHPPSPVCQQMLYDAPQEGPKLLPEDQKPLHGLPQGFLAPLLLTVKLSRRFWRPLSHFHPADRCVNKAFWSKRMKRQFNQPNLSRARSPFRLQQFWCDLPAWQVTHRSVLNVIPSFFLFSFQLIHISQWQTCLPPYKGFEAREKAVLENQNKSTCGSYRGLNHTYGKKLLWNHIKAWVKKEEENHM